METSTTPRPGRPRDERVDAAILDAALALFIEGGVTFDGIAARSGISRTAIYRRWTTREDVIVAALRRTRSEGEKGLEDWAARPVAEVTALFTDLAAATLTDPAAIGLLRRIAALDEDSPIRRCYLDEIVTPRRQAFTTMIETARRRGELPPGPDPELLQDRLAGTLMYRALLGSAPLDAAGAREYIKDLLTSLGLTVTPPGGNRP